MFYVKKNEMLMLAGLTLLAIPEFSMPALADNVTQTVEMVKVDVQELSTGYRASKIIGTNILNDAGENIGKIDDLIVSPNDNKSAYVVLSVGGWLGMGSHLVALPYGNLRITSSKITLPNASKEALKTLPEFKYSTI